MVLVYLKTTDQKEVSMAEAREAPIQKPTVASRIVAPEVLRSRVGSITNVSLRPGEAFLWHNYFPYAPYIRTSWSTVTLLSVSEFPELFIRNENAWPSDNWVLISEARVRYCALKTFLNPFLKWVIYANSTKFIRRDRQYLKSQFHFSLNPPVVSTGLHPGYHSCVPIISNHLLRWIYALKICHHSVEAKSMQTAGQLPLAGNVTLDN